VCASQMGASGSTEAVLPFPTAWLPNPTAAQLESVVTEIRGISAIEPDRFLSVRAPLAELEDTAWELAAYKDHAAAAVKADIGLNRLVYKCVPKKVNEVEFWRCFFCWVHHMVTKAPRTLDPPALTKAVFEKEDSSTTSAIIGAFRGHPKFDAFSQAEMDGILKRDAEDDEKLAAGILMAVEKGVLAANPPVEPTTTVDVLGKTADEVAAEIITALAGAPAKGCVLILQGLSGTGKGTTVSKLQQLLPRCTSWSNGNVFRALTLLAVSRCEQSGTPFGPDVLTAPFLAELMACLSFGKFGPGGVFDIKICGYGHDVLVSQVANTTLKEAKVGKNIPTVAKMTQGEVVGFAAGAAEAMRADGMNVLVEGRAQTLNYVRSPHRFELILSEPLLIGMRRAAQRMMGSASDALKKSPDADIKVLLSQALDEFAK